MLRSTDSTINAVRPIITTHADHEYTMNTLQLETPRLLLTAMQATDRDFFFALNHNQEAMRYIDDPRTDNNIDTRFSERLLDWTAEASHWLTLIIRKKDDGTPMGMHGFLPEWVPYRQAELGYMMLPQWHGQGFALEATRAVVDYAFKTCGFHKLKATVTQGNLASERLLKRAGFQLEGRLRDNFQLGGEWYDDMKYGLLASDLRP
jgi:RimJ/RimL family protein N-acetyltransferase